MRKLDFPQKRNSSRGVRSVKYHTNVTNKKDTKGAQICVLLHPPWFPPNNPKSFGMNGGDDGARTRDLCRDRLESGGTDGSFQRPEERLATLIAPLSNPGPLSTRPLSTTPFLVQIQCQNQHP